MNLLSFDNTTIAFSDKSTIDLFKSYWLFRFMNNKTLVSLGSKILNTAIKYKIPLNGLIKSTVFRQFCGGETLTECNEVVKTLKKHNVSSIPDYFAEASSSDEFNNIIDEKIKCIRNAKDHYPEIPSVVLKITSIANHLILEKVSHKTNIDAQITKEYEQIIERVNILCKLSYDNNVPILIDAEESWVQNSIDDIVWEMMNRYNTKKTIVFNTIQMYRKDRVEYLNQLMEKTFQKNLFLGLKIVRGAYLEAERSRAKVMGYQSPIHETKEDTDKSFDKAIEICLLHLEKIELCVATHNEESIIHFVKMLQERGIIKNHPHIYFAQLYGMGDQITFNLSSNGFNSVKYIPFGPVNKVLPYLIRRAEENSSIKGQISRELKLISKERERRRVN